MLEDTIAASRCRPRDQTQAATESALAHTGPLSFASPLALLPYPDNLPRPQTRARRSIASQSNNTMDLPPLHLSFPPDLLLQTLASLSWFLSFLLYNSWEPADLFNGGASLFWMASNCVVAREKFWEGEDKRKKMMGEGGRTGEAEEMTGV
jgi:hypothetical protein